MGEIKLTAREARVINAMRANTGLPSVKQGTSANVVVATPVEAAPRTFATKADRAAGNGFACPNCLRRDLRVAVHPGSYHDKDVNGNKAETCRF